LDFAKTEMLGFCSLAVHTSLNVWPNDMDVYLNTLKIWLTAI